MTFTTRTGDHARTALKEWLQWLADALYTHLRDARIRHQSRDCLKSFSAQQLKDLGLTANEIDRLIRRGR